jgi:hypothetical protein
MPIREPSSHEHLRVPLAGDGEITLRRSRATRKRLQEAVAPPARRPGGPSRHPRGAPGGSRATHEALREALAPPTRRSGRLSRHPRGAPGPPNGPCGCLQRLRDAPRGTGAEPGADAEPGAEPGRGRDGAETEAVASASTIREPNAQPVGGSPATGAAGGASSGSAAGWARGGFRSSSARKGAWSAWS